MKRATHGQSDSGQTVQHSIDADDDAASQSERASMHAAQKKSPRKNHDVTGSIDSAINIATPPLAHFDRLATTRLAQRACLTVNALCHIAYPLKKPEPYAEKSCGRMAMSL